MSTDWPTPYYACIFTNQRTDSGADIYEMMAAEMVALAASQPGFLGWNPCAMQVGWGSRYPIGHRWRRCMAGLQAAHKKVQEMGRAEFYSWFQLRIAEVSETRQFGLAALADQITPPDAAAD